MGQEAIRRLYPIQPDYLIHTEHYHETIIQWNPLTQNSALFFQFEVSETGINTFHMVPDGCVELLFNCSEEKPSAIFFGKRTKLMNLSLNKNTTYFGFKPFYEAGFQLSKVAYLELINQRIPLKDAIDSELLIKAIAKAKSFEERCQIFTTLGINQLFLNKSYINDYLVNYNQKICLSFGKVSISQLASTIGYSERHLRQSYKSVFGITPVTYKKIIRFQNSLHLSYNSQATESHQLTDLSFSSGYYDQSHMGVDYRELVGMSPKNLQQVMSHS